MFSKGLVAASLEPLLLALLSGGEMYGYEIIQRVHEVSGGRIRWTASKLYPVLHDLENKGAVVASWKSSESGPDRKYYRLTPHGHKLLEATRREWLDMSRIMEHLWNPGLTLEPIPAI